MSIRIAVKDDINQCDRIARQYDAELGFVQKAKLMQGVENRELFVACEDNTVVGFVLWHRRRDGISTVYDLAVDNNHRRKGIGRALLYAVPLPIRLKCTAENPANKFYVSVGMILAGTEPSKRKTLNIYVLPVIIGKRLLKGNDHE